MRRLAAADVPAYRALRLKGLRDHPRAFGGDADEEAAMPEAQWQARVTQSACFGVFAGDQLVGTATLLMRAGRKNRHVADLVGLYVSTPGQGAGRAVSVSAGQARVAVM